ncbi:MAG TPA: low affinity iron permease family protein [Casimicrobiaceae bacterium]|jgi:low affinity Fe/Cu permease|nr:low affinity iron permease family protein [Casimicrobiaceae bacterium]
MNDWFRHVAHKLADAFGSSSAFLAAAIFIAVWAVTGPMFGFSEAWQLVANTITNVVTFLMVFVIQNSQNRDTKATQLKLDELLRAIGNARSSLINLESLSDDEMERLQKQFEAVRERAVDALDKR